MAEQHLGGALTGNGSGLTNLPAGNLTGTVAIANGGTGQTTANAALNALLPSQTAGYYLTSDGTNTSFAAVAAGTNLGIVLAIRYAMR